MFVYRRIILFACITIAAASATMMPANITEANHASAANEITITHSSSDPGPGGGGTTLNVPVGGTFTVETTATTVSTSAPGYGYALSWTDAIVNPIAHVVDSQCAAFPLSCTCLGPTPFTLAGNEGVTGSCIRTTAVPPGPPPPIAAGDRLLLSTLTCGSAGTTLVKLLGSDSNPATYTSLRTALGTPVATTLENQVTNTSPPPTTVAAVSVVCYQPVDASLVKTAPATATEGDTITYTLTLANTHPTLPLDIDLSDSVPSGVTFLSFTESDPGACTMTASLLTCDDLRVAAAGTGTVTISARLNTCGGVANSASITGVSSPGTTVLDSVAANNTSSANTATSCLVDASLAKSGPISVASGGSGTYVLSATNPDPTPAISVTIADNAPVGVTFTSVDNGGCTISSGTLLQCTLTLNALTTTVIHVGATFTGCVSVINSATLVVTSVVDPNPANNVAMATTDVVCTVDTSITKSGPASVLSDGTGTYVLAATNPATTPPVSATIIDTAPAGVTFTSVDNAGCSITSGVLLQCALTLPPTSTTVVHVGATFGGCVPAVNAVTMTALNVIDPNPENNVANTSSDQVCTVDTSITKSGPASVTTGGSGTYVLAATNPASTPPISATIIDTAPAGVTFTAVDNAGCSITGGVLLQCSLTLPPSSTTTVHVDATFTGCVAVLNAVAMTALNVIDPNPANNAAAATTDVACMVDIVLAKSGPASVLTGASGTYALSATNPDPAIPVSATIVDTAPAGVTFTAVDNAGCMIVGGALVQCTLTLPPSSTTVIHIDATFTGCVSAVNTAALAALNVIDPNPANNTANATTDVTCLVDASITKTGPAFVFPTGTVDTYVLQATNPDPAFTLNATIADVAPPGVPFTGVDNPGCTLTGGVTINCTILILPSSTVTIRVTARFDVCGLAANSAALVVGAPILDPNPANNVSAVTTSICGSPDIDGDGCTEFEELGPDHKFGGQRNPLDGNDFFDVPAPSAGATQPDGHPVLGTTATRDKVISLVDVGVVLSYVGRIATNPAYTADNNADLKPDGLQLDRTPSLVPGQLWRSGSPNGAISLQDAAVALASVGDNCTPLPS
jgi:uncharacterized repeat protein (TIGR01451 family)